MRILGQHTEQLRANQASTLHLEHFMLEQIRLSADARAFHRHAGGETLLKSARPADVPRVPVDFTVVLLRAFVTLRNGISHRPPVETLATLAKRKAC